MWILSGPGGSDANMATTSPATRAAWTVPSSRLHSEQIMTRNAMAFSDEISKVARNWEILLALQESLERMGTVFLLNQR